MLNRLRQPGTLIAVLALVLSMTTGAVAAKLITGKDIADGSVTGVDLKGGSVPLNRLTAETQSQILKGAQKSAQGPAGAQGPQGTAGSKGDTGGKGDTGAAGAKGDTGAAGAKGDTGAAGAKGDTGAAGAKGDTGAAGAKGDAGLTGAAGIQGETGAPGLKGDTGSKGDAGAKGDKGDAGAAGPSGVAGAKGDKGEAGTTGPSGATGAKGDAGLDAVHPVASLFAANDAVPAFGWIGLGSNCSDPTSSQVGTASIAGGHVKLTTSTDPGEDTYGLVQFNGLNGVRLKDVERVEYSDRATGGSGDQFNAPYFRFRTSATGDPSEGTISSVVYTPGTQPGDTGGTEGWRRHVVTDGTLRVNDDAGNGPDLTWKQVLADHGNERIKQTRIVFGCGGAYTSGGIAWIDNVKLQFAGDEADFNFG